MASHFERNDARRSRKSEGRRPQQARPTQPAGGAEWLWGHHPVEAALANPRRTGLRRLVAASGKGGEALASLAGAVGLRVEALDPQEIARLLPTGAVHQGLALLADPLAPAALDEVAEPAHGVLVLLDQVADPQNVGAVFRSAAAFGARGVILQERRAPPLSGALGKASAGAIDRTPCVRVVNLSRTLEDLAERGWRAIGLAGEAEATLDQVLDGGPVVLVLGSEGEGMRRLVAEHCDTLARIPMAGGFQSLNVAAAAAIALYAACSVAVTRPTGEKA